MRPTCVSMDVVELWPSDIPDIVELIDCIDELEPRLTSCVEPFRGGRAGEGCSDPFLSGSGGTLRAGSRGVLAFGGGGLSRSTGGGGRIFLTPVG